MKPTQNQPYKFPREKTLDLSSKIGALALNVLALFSFVLFFWVFSQLAAWFHPPAPFTISNNTLATIGLLLSIALALIAHELLHGLFFWFFTGARPVFGFNGWYAYAAAPDWYLPRNQHIIIGLAPFFLLSLLGVVIMPLLPAAWMLYWLLLISMHAAGCVGDFIAISWELTRSRHAYICDRGISCTAYEPE